MNFREEILKLRSHHHHKITNCIGIKDMLKWFTKNKWFGLKEIKEKQLRDIIRNVHLEIVEELFKGNIIVFPWGMGSIYIKKIKTFVDYANGRMITNYPVNWKATLELWEHDLNARKNKTLIRFDDKNSFKFVYAKLKASYKNRLYYSIAFNRKLKLRLKDIVLTKRFDVLCGTN